MEERPPSVGEAAAGDADARDGAPPGAPPAPPALGVSGVVLTKAQLLDALRLYFPNGADFGPLPDGQHFYVLLRQDTPPQP